MRNKLQIRNNKGSAIAETGPALLILFMFLFFPLIDVMTMGIDYVSTYTLNSVQLREAANLPKSQAADPAGQVKHNIPQQWKHSGMGAFVNVIGTPDTTVDYKTGESDSTGTQDRYVVVTTKLTAQPFLTLPFPIPVPGMSAPMTFTIQTRRLLENPHFFDA
jgi:hypothetical protein